VWAATRALPSICAAAGVDTAALWVYTRQLPEEARPTGPERPGRGLVTPVRRVQDIIAEGES
jgi:hypothetical protein